MSFVSAAPLFTARNSRSGYQIEQSLRFDGSSYLTRTPASSGSTSETFSCWVKVTDLGNYGAIFGRVITTSSTYRVVVYNSSSYFQDVDGSGATSSDNGKHRDPSAWYHVVVQVESGVGTRLYINGELYASDSNTNTFTANGKAQGIGRFSDISSSLFKGYIAEVHFISGATNNLLNPSSFGEYDNNGVWRPIQYTGSHGTQGFYLKFDPSATNGIGHDHSGNGNTWTANNFTTSGTGTDVMSDTPTTNWATLNSLDSFGGNFFEGNLQFAGTYSSGGSQNGHGCRSTIRVPSGKWYVEASNTTYSGSGNSCMLGFTSSTQAISASAFTANLTPWIGVDASVYNNNVRFYWNGVSGGTTSGTTLYASYASGDIINLAIDFDAGKIWVGKNGSYAGDPGAGTNPTSTFTVGDGSWAFWAEYVASGDNSNRSQANVNFGQRAFEYTQPSGFKAMNTANLPAPDIADGSDYFNTVLYTGTSSTQSITGIGYQPDFTWVKRRDSANSNALFDALRGAGERLSSNETTAEVDNTAYFTSFDSDGFSVASNGGETNLSGATYVAWNWKAGGSGSSNTAGSITSTVSASPSSGFSIATYTGGGSAATVGHGLGVAPAMVITKDRDTTHDWYVYHSGLTSGHYIKLNNTSASASDTSIYSSAPSSTVINYGSSVGVVANGDNFVAYCFAEVEGYSKFGSYTGNGSNDGVFLWCGFKPQWVMIKRTDAAANWVIIDATRNPYNAAGKWLLPDSSASEYNYDALYPIDILSNGFKLRTSVGSLNSGTFIFAAFAENPFGGDGVSPATAR